MYYDIDICYLLTEKTPYHGDIDYHKVNYHYHFTGKFKSAACSICSFRYPIPRKILVILQIKSNYDFRSIIKQLAEEFENSSLNVFQD